MPSVGVKGRGQKKQRITLSKNLKGRGKTVQRKQMCSRDRDEDR